MSVSDDDLDLQYAIAQSWVDLQKKFPIEKKEEHEVVGSKHLEFDILNQQVKKLETEMHALVPFFGSTNWTEQIQLASSFLVKFDKELSDMSTRMEILSIWIVQNNMSCFSPNGVSLLKAKVVLEGVRILKASIEETKQTSEIWHSRFMRNNLPFVFIRVLEGMNTSEFCNLITDTHAPVVVLSLGSWGQKTQQFPQFVKDLVALANEGASNVTAEVLNIDPQFKHEAVECSNNQVLIRAYAGKFPMNPAWQSANGGIPFEVNKEIATALQKALENIVENPNRKLVLLDHCSPFLPTVFFEMGKKYQDKIGSELEIIGNYFTELPTVVYSKGAFQCPDYKTFLTQMDPFWKYIFSGNPVHVQTVQAQYPVEAFGRIYQHLDKLPFAALLQSAVLNVEVPAVKMVTRRMS